MSEPAPTCAASAAALLSGSETHSTKSWSRLGPFERQPVRRVVGIDPVGARPQKPTGLRPERPFPGRAQRQPPWGSGGFAGSPAALVIADARDGLWRSAFRTSSHRTLWRFHHLRQAVTVMTVGCYSYRKTSQVVWSGLWLRRRCGWHRADGSTPGLRPRGREEGHCYQNRYHRPASGCNAL